MSTIRARLTAPRPDAKTTAAAARPRAEVVVVTLDPELESALRQASPAAPVMVATSPAALADLLMTGRAGTLVLDVAALDAAALTVARHLAEQFPDVPLVAVGSREDEARLAGLISSGLVYRFLHRPVSVARARTFVEAALRRHGGSRAPLRSQAPPPAPRRRIALSRSAALAAAAGALVVGLTLALALRAPPPADPPAAPRAVCQRPRDQCARRGRRGDRAAAGCAGTAGRDARARRGREPRQGTPATGQHRAQACRGTRPHARSVPGGHPGRDRPRRRRAARAAGRGQGRCTAGNTERRSRRIAGRPGDDAGRGWRRGCRRCDRRARRAQAARRCLAARSARPHARAHDEGARPRYAWRPSPAGSKRDAPRHQRPGPRVRRRARDAAAVGAARRAGPDRHEVRLRHGAVRRLHRAPRRPGDALLRDAAVAPSPASKITTIEGVGGSPIGKTVQDAWVERRRSAVRLLPVGPDHVGAAALLADQSEARPTPTSTPR